MPMSFPGARSLPKEPSRPALLACSNCRRKHLRCDANHPICARCAGRGLQCAYTPSRRGYRVSGCLNPEAGQAPSSVLPIPGTNQVVLSPPPAPLLNEPRSEFVVPTATEDLGLSRNNRDERRNPTQYYRSCQDASPPQRALSSASYQSILTSPPPSSSSSSSSADDKQLVNLFYTYFHPAHPILLPNALYFLRGYPNYLKVVVHFIGSHYSSSTLSDHHRLAAMEGLADGDPKTPFMVQARLLFAIALHGRNEIKEAQAMLGQAVSLALEMGMNRKNFATTHGRNQTVEEESLRRTWWELYVVDGIMAGFWRKSEFSIHSFASDVLLPCEEPTYMDAACLPNPPTVAQFDNRLFADDEVKFSSFCYRIEAARILARVLALTGAQETQQDHVQAVDNALAGWAHHLPPEKAEIINTYGEVDEILFQAHMIIQYATIFLHFPRSNLLSTPAATAGIPGDQRDNHVSPASTQHTHAIKATEASKQLSNLAALRLPVQNHTPFFICGLVLGAVVQLSACSIHAGNCLEQHRDRVTLMIGVLKSLSQTWAFSLIVLREIKKVAAEVFNIREVNSNSLPPTITQGRVVNINVEEENSWLDSFDIHALHNLMPFDTEMVYAELT
jgi:Fungal specific transcription factor domain/Fungal Zn(2)-Cys(6) binuclear cluster domain